jgi:hypothetical protein
MLCEMLLLKPMLTFCPLHQASVELPEPSKKMVAVVWLRLRVIRYSRSTGGGTFSFFLGLIIFGFAFLSSELFCFRLLLLMRRSMVKLWSRLLLLMMWWLLLVLRLRGSRQKSALDLVVLLVPEVLKMSAMVERRCDLGVGLVCHVIYIHFSELVNFDCHAQACVGFTTVRACVGFLVTISCNGL